MKIKVRLFATLRANRGKELFLEFTNEATPMDILRELNILKEDVAILLINGRDGKFDSTLENEDTVSIFPPVGGG